MPEEAGSLIVAGVDGFVGRHVVRIGVTSPYVVSNMLVESQMDYYRRRGLRAVVTRPFNHIGSTANNQGLPMGSPTWRRTPRLQGESSDSHTALAQRRTADRMETQRR